MKKFSKKNWNDWKYLADKELEKNKEKKSLEWKSSDGILFKSLYTEDDLNGFNAALNKVATIPHSNSIKEAWLKTEVAIKSYHVVNRNSNKFSDDKVIRKMAKDFE